MPRKAKRPIENGDHAEDVENNNTKKAKTEGEFS
jgi:hypothetical protein